jgi:hypothetical protein
VDCHNTKTGIGKTLGVASLVQESLVSFNEREINICRGSSLTETGTISITVSEKSESMIGNILIGRKVEADEGPNQKQTLNLCRPCARWAEGSNQRASNIQSTVESGTLNGLCHFPSYELWHDFQQIGIFNSFRLSKDMGPLTTKRRL